MKRLCVALLLLTAGGCTRPGDHAFSPTCQWVEDADRSLNLHDPGDREHLRNDALAAEDMAISYATKTACPKSRNFAGFSEYRRQMNECMAALFIGVANYHGVAIALVRVYRLRRNTAADAAVMLSFGALYALLAWWAAGVILRDFTHDEHVAILLVAILSSVGVSLLGVMAGELWSVSIESLRLGSWHLSYRQERVPWIQHRIELFICGVVIVWLCMAIRYRNLTPDTVRSHPRVHGSRR